MKKKVSLINKLINPFRHLAWGLSCLYPKKTITLKTKQGVFKSVRNIYDPITTSLFVRKNFELALMQKFDDLANKHLIQHGYKPGGTLLDIGANNGVICIGMLRNFGFSKAIAIEPEPTNIELLRYNVENNGLAGKIKVLHSAASDSPSSLTMEISTKNSGDHRIRMNGGKSKGTELYDESRRKTIEVPANTVDYILEGIEDSFTSNISLLWIDVQGYEGFVFKGAKKLISTGIPVVSEIWPYAVRRAGMTDNEFCEIIKNAGWSHYWIETEEGFEKRAIDTFDDFYVEVDKVRHGNVIFTA